MKGDNWLWFLLACFMGWSALKAVFTGENIGLSAGGISARGIHFSSSPLEFSLMTLCQIGMSIWLFKIYYSDDEDD